MLIIHQWKRHDLAEEANVSFGSARPACRAMLDKMQAIKSGVVFRIVFLMVCTQQFQQASKVISGEF